MAYKLCELSLLVAGKQLCETLNSLHPYSIKILFKTSYISPVCKMTTRDRCHVSIYRLARSIFHLLSDRFFTLLYYYYLAHNVILAYSSITHPPSLFSRWKLCTLALLQPVRLAAGHLGSSLGFLQLSSNLKWPISYANQAS